MTKRLYYPKHIKYLREITPGRRDAEITKLFNKKFNMNATTMAIKTLRLRNGILLTVPRTKTWYQKEHIDYLRELSGQGLFNAEITKRFNEKFGTDKTEVAIQNQRGQHRLFTSARYRWKKGHISWNKGRKGYMGPNKTSFKKGNIPANWRPVGSERVTTEGYTEVKIQDGKLNKNWRMKHLVIWEKANGPIPKGHVVIFGNGDKGNLSLDNLVLVSRSQLVRMNQLGLIYDDAELTKTGAVIAAVRNKIGERKRKHKAGD